MDEREDMIKIPLKAYEKLLDLESRVRAAGELALKEVSEESVYLVIGTDAFRAVVDKKNKEHQAFLERLKEKEKEKENGN